MKNNFLNNFQLKQRHPQKKVFTDKISVRITNEDEILLQNIAMQVRAKTGKKVSNADVVRYAIELLK